MTHADEHDRVWSSEIVSVVSAEPGGACTFRRSFTIGAQEKFVELDAKYHVMAWALVRSNGDDGQPFKRVEPMFLAKGAVFHSTEYRRMYSNPKPGRPKCIVHIEVLPPTESTTD